MDTLNAASAPVLSPPASALFAVAVPSILLYYDGSAEAKRALRRAAEYALARAATIHVLTVAETLPAIAASTGLLSDIAYGEILDKGWRTLDEALAALREHGAHAQGHLAHGAVVENIARHATLVDADTIVMGFRHRHLIERWWRPDPTLDDVMRSVDGRTVMAVPLR